MLMTENRIRVSTGSSVSCFSVKEESIINPLAAAVLLRKSRLWGIKRVVGSGLWKRNRSRKIMNLFIDCWLIPNQISWQSWISNKKDSNSMSKCIRPPSSACYTILPLFPWTLLLYLAGTFFITRVHLSIKICLVLAPVKKLSIHPKREIFTKGEIVHGIKTYR